MKHLCKLTAAVLAVLCLSPLPAAAEPALVPDWVPMDFMEALAFENTYGRTHVDDGAVCCVRYMDNNEDYRYDIVPSEDSVDPDSICVYSAHYEFEMPEAPDPSDSKAMAAYEQYCWEQGIDPLSPPYFSYDVAVYRPINTQTLSFDWTATYLPLDRETERTHLSFRRCENGVVEETDDFGWLPDCVEEFEDFREQNGTISVHDGRIVYCDDICYDGGASLVAQQSGTARVVESIRYTLEERRLQLVSGGTGDTVCVYDVVTPGTIRMSFIETRTWLEEDPYAQTEQECYRITGDGTITVIPEEEVVERCAGDCNSDGVCNMLDAVVLQKHLLGEGTLSCWQNADLYEDNRINVLDLTLLKQMLTRAE